MATSSPPSPLYDHEQRGLPFLPPFQQQYFIPEEPYHARSYFYAGADPSSANSLRAHDASAARLAVNQVSPPHQYYGDAAPSVIPYAAEYISHSGDDWVQQKPLHADSTQAYASQAVTHLPPYYDSGEVSPASDDSSGTFYDSPHPSDDARLVDERGCGEAHAHPCVPAFSGYDAAAAFPPASVITAERYSYLAGQESDLQQASSTFYEEPTSYHPQHQPPPSLSHLSFNSDFTGGSEDSVHSHSHEYIQRPPSGDNLRTVSPPRYRSAVEPLRVSRASASMPVPHRTQSPMAHLPYGEVDAYRGGSEPNPQQFYLAPSSSGASPFTYASVDPPVCPQPQYHAALHAPFPEPIAIPAPRSPPLVEDTPKKPLTLACFFCRKRKIACGSPPPGKKDRTCNQCARRNLRCEYPVNSRRGTRQREAEAALYPSAVYGRASS